MFGLVGRLKDRLQIKWRHIIGVAIQDDGSVCLLELIEGTDGNGWQVKERMELPAEAGGDLWGQANRIAAKLAAAGLSDVPVVLLAKKEEEHMLPVPPGMTEGERQEAAYWELDVRLAAKGLEREDYVAAICSLPQNPRLWGSIVRRDYLDEVRAAFEQAGVRLIDVFITPDTEMGKALCRGVSYWQKQGGRKWGCALLHQQESPVGWNWPVMAAIVAGMAIFLSCAVIGWDSWMLYAARQENWSAKQEMVRLASEQNKMKLLERIGQETTGKEKLLQELSAKTIPWYSVLVHLGSRTVEGVWLERLEFEGRNKLHLTGRAASYEAVAAFVQAFEEDRDFFPQGAVLESSGEVEKQSPQPEGDGSISFQLSITL